MKSIKCFSVDHRDLSQSAKWPFSWIRLGTGFTNDCAIKDTVQPSICTERFNAFLGEWTAIWWVYAHLSDFGSTDYIGIANYRRFFTKAKPNYGIFPIFNYVGPLDQRIIDSILTPEELLEICQANNLDGILPTRFPDYSYAKGCKDVVDLMSAESKWLKLEIPEELCKIIFNFLASSCSKHFTEENVRNAMLQTSTFHFNVFVLEKSLFQQYVEIVDGVVSKSIEYIDANKIERLHPRVFGYVIERLSSCVFFMMMQAGKKFAEIPVTLFDKSPMTKLT